eukprot:366273-Chlamydomonas_euryale.AAC.11
MGALGGRRGRAAPLQVRQRAEGVWVRERGWTCGHACCGCGSVCAAGAGNGVGMCCAFLRSSCDALLVWHAWHVLIHVGSLVALGRLDWLKEVDSLTDLLHEDKGKDQT